MEAVRTNNDTEGWHYALKRRAEGTEDTAAPTPTHSATSPGSQIDLTANQASNRKEALGRIQAGERSAKQLLKGCTNLVGPAGSSH